MAAARVEQARTLRCGGVSISLTNGWYGRVQRGYGGLFTVAAATFPLPHEADADDQKAARAMSQSDVLVLLIGYGPSGVSGAPFRAHVHLPLTVAMMSTHHQFEHLPKGHTLARLAFKMNAGAYDLQVQFAQLRPTSVVTRRADAILRTLRFAQAPNQLSGQPTRC